MAKGDRVLRSGRRVVWTAALGLMLFISVGLLLMLGLGLVGVPSGLTPSDASISLRLPTHTDTLNLQINEEESKTKQWVEAISWAPRASIFHNFLTDEECDHLIRISMPLMKKSTVVDSATGQSKDSRVRTSSGTFLYRGQDRVVSAIEDRIARFTFIPKNHGEGIQVLHYEPGQKYDAHYDYFFDAVNTKNGGQRIATLLMYLTDVEEGGETVFPNSVANATTLRYYNQLSECGKRGISVLPRRGDALLFWSMSPSAELDSTSLHGGCPVIKDERDERTSFLMSLCQIISGNIPLLFGICVASSAPNSAMAMNPGAFTDWPWERFGSYKYVLYVPLLAKAIHTNFVAREDDGSAAENFFLHILLLSALRYLQGQLWMTLTRLYDVVHEHRIQQKSIKFEQLDRESNWENFILCQALMLSAYHSLSLFQIHPLWNWKGFIFSIFWHIGPVEFIYYWFHRLLHHHYLYRRYHSHHHLSFLTEAITGNVHPFAEHFAYAWLFGSTFIVSSYLGIGSIALLYIYTLWFDVMNYVGHCNWEFVPVSFYQAFPLLKYLVYTPSFHSLHHTQVHTNFCLFVPMYDYLYGTVDKSSDALYLKARKGQREENVDFVYLSHATDLLSIFHFPFGFTYFATHPYAKKWYMWLLLPLTVPIMLLLWAFGRPFTVDAHEIDGFSLRTWALPRFDFHYWMPSEMKKINSMIEECILAAQESGVKVITLGRSNNYEHLNACGALFVKSIEGLKIRIVDGSTLTAAAVVKKIPLESKEYSVFITGATTKVSRSIILYLCCKLNIKVKVLVTSSLYHRILQTIPKEYQKNILMIFSFQEARDCNAWVIEGVLRKNEQMMASIGTKFFPLTKQLTKFRKECTYYSLPAMRLPENTKGLRACEGGLERGVVEACHGGGILHMMEGWSEHEVGILCADIHRIDYVWNAALRRGFIPC